VFGSARAKALLAAWVAPVGREQALSPKTAQIFLCLFLLLASTACVLLEHPLAPLSVNAPTTEFSAERAMLHLWNFAQRPHPVGSAEHDRTRDYLVNALTQLGLPPEIQRTTGVTARYMVAGTVENIVARLKGSAGSSGAVLLSAHYDSVPAGPGAGDDGSGVVTLLETVRVLRAALPLRNDVVVLFTDGEEEGLLGASAFMAEHPWARDARIALNFDAPGNAGVSRMFETSAGNGPLVEILAQAVPRASATSLSYEIYKHMHNDSDMTVFKNAGAAGLNFGFIGHWEAYHTPLDNPQQLDRGSVQQDGVYSLALARSFGNADLDSLKGPDAVYFSLPGGALLHYSSTRVWMLVVLAIVALLAITLYANGAYRIGTTGILAAFFVILLMSLGLLLAGLGFAKGIERLHASLLPEGNVVQNLPYFLSLAALLLAVWLRLHALLCRKFSPASLLLGDAAILTVLTIVTAKWLTGGSFLFLWPQLALVLALPAACSPKEQPSALRVLAVCLLSLPAVTIFVPVLRGSYEAIGLMALGAPALSLMFALFLIALGPAIELMTRGSKSLLPLGAFLAAILLFGIGAATTHYSAAHPKPSTMAYALNADTGKAIWASSAAHIDPWTAQFVGASPERGKLRGFYPDWVPLEFLQHEAAPCTLPPPDALLEQSSISGDTRTILLRITSPRHARTISVAAPENEILDSWVNGRKLGNPKEARWNPSGRWSLDYANPPSDGIELKLILKGSAPLRLLVTDGSMGLPQIPGQSLAPRPADSMPRHSGDETLVQRSFVF